MSIIDLKLGGLVGLSVGSLAVAAYSSYVGGVAVEAAGIILGLVSGFFYVGIQVDRYINHR